MPGHNIVVIGTSAGGVEALTRLAAGLPSDLAASLFVVVHFPAHATSALPRILERAGPLPAAHAEPNEPIRPGRIYVARPNYHLLVMRSYVHLTRGPRENGHRPAVDPLFRSAALSYGRRVIGVVLSGTLDDGTAGLLAIKRRGGIAVVQDPDDALYPGMPQSAIENAAVDHVVPISEMAELLVQLVREPAVEKAGEPVSGEMEEEIALSELDLEAVGSDTHPGTPSSFACPECGGTLWELQDGALSRFRCRVGHAFSTDSLLVEQSEAVEAALWTALRALEERIALERRLTVRARQRGSSRVAERFDRQVRDTEQRASTIRELLLSGSVLDTATLSGGEVQVESEGHVGGRPARGG